MGAPPNPEIPQIPPVVKGLLRQILSEPGPNGTGSTSRLATILIVISTLTWVSASVVHTGKLDMDTVEAALAFMSGGGFTFYGVNRVTAGLQPKDKSQP